MVCDFCHENEAVIFLEQVSGNGQKRKLNICMDCAIERGISSDPKSIEASIGNLFKEFTETTKRIQALNNRMCPVCGTTIGDIKRKGIAGCPECYAIFKTEIRGYLENIGLKEHYSGSVPSRLASFHSVLNDRMALQDKLNDAVAKEDYEKAAMYRDYLRALEKNAVSGSGEE